MVWNAARMFEVLPGKVFEVKQWKSDFAVAENTPNWSLSGVQLKTDFVQQEVKSH